MNKESTKTVKDSASFEKIFNEIFVKFQPSLKDGKLRTGVTFKNYTDNKVYFEITDLDISVGSCIIQCRDNSANTYYADLKFLEKSDNNVYIFSPVGIQISFSPRKEPRISLDPEKNANHRLYIINMISEFVIKHSFEINKQKIADIEKIIRVKLEKVFEHIKLSFLKSTHDDRMEYFRKNIKPIFIPDINGEPAKKYEDIFNYYKSNIRVNDFLLANNNFISEISIPILYRMKVPYGYVQVNSRNPFKESSLSIVKKIAIVMNELLIKHGLFPQAEEKIMVSDVSQHGLGLRFKDKKCIKYFFKDQLVYFDLVLPDNTKANILANIKNINILGIIYKVGCKIVEIDALSEVNYYEYLGSIGMSLEEEV